MQTCVSKQETVEINLGVVFLRFEGGVKSAVALEEGEKAAVAEPRHAGGTPVNAALACAWWSWRSP